MSERHKKVVQLRAGEASVTESFLGQGNKGGEEALGILKCTRRRDMQVYFWGRSDIKD